MVQTVKHSEKKMFSGSFSYQKVGSLCPVHGIMNLQQYIQVLNKKKLQTFKRNTLMDLVIPARFCSLSHVKKVIKHFYTHKIKTLDCPWNSPDLNPIENLWTIAKGRLCDRDCATKTRLIESIIQISCYD